MSRRKRKRKPTQYDPTATRPRGHQLLTAEQIKGPYLRDALNKATHWVIAGASKEGQEILERAVRLLEFGCAPEVGAVEYLCLPLSPLATRIYLVLLPKKHVPVSILCSVLLLSGGTAISPSPEQDIVVLAPPELCPLVSAFLASAREGKLQEGQMRDN